MYFYRFFIHMNPCLCITEHLCILYMQLIVSSKGSCLSVSSMFFQTSKLTITTSYEHIYVHQYTNVYDIWTDLHKRKIFCRVQHAFSARDGTPPLLNLKSEEWAVWNRDMYMTLLDGRYGADILKYSWCEEILNK